MVQKLVCHCGQCTPHETIKQIQAMSSARRNRDFQTNTTPSGEEILHISNLQLHRQPQIDTPSIPKEVILVFKICPRKQVALLLLVCACVHEDMQQSINTNFGL
jgi:hypothetical protein